MFGTAISPFWNDFAFFGAYAGVGRVALSIVILLIGFVVARNLTSFVRSSMAKLVAKEPVQDSPLGALFESTNALKGSGVATSVLYWLVVFIFLSIAGELLGITFFTHVVNLIVGYVPSVLSAVIVFVFGVVVSGVIEKIVKTQFKRVAPQQAVLAGTLSSYVSLVLFMMIALSELGIASDFILILFGGFVFATALALGIAFGFGAKDIVAEMLSSMVTEEKQLRRKVK